MTHAVLGVRSGEFYLHHDASEQSDRVTMRYEIASEMKAPWLGQYGDQDTGIPIEQVERLRLVTDQLPFDTEIIRYADAGHAFNCDDRPKSYNAGAADAAWHATLDWFNKHIS